MQPNVALDDGSLDANYFQTVPYLEEQEADAGYDFAPLAPVHIEPLGIYSESLPDLAALPDGATVAIPNDPTNAARALRLLEANGLITLADTGDAAPTSLDVQDSPKDLQISEVEAAQVPRSLADVDIAVVNGNYAIEADLVPAEDALALEEAEGNPNANLLVVRAGDEDDERIQQLEGLLHSDEVRRFIEEEQMFEVQVKHVPEVAYVSRSRSPTTGVRSPTTSDTSAASLRSTSGCSDSR